MSGQKYTSLESTLALLRTITGKNPQQSQAQGSSTDSKNKFQDSSDNERKPSTDSVSHSETEQQTTQITNKSPAGKRSLSPLFSKHKHNKKVDETKKIKRIIGYMQPTLLNYYKGNPNVDFIEGNSSSTKLNIYLKQNQRILKSIRHKRELQKKLVEERQSIDEQKLQYEYFFTVKDAYRDQVMVVTSKNKISKENYRTIDFVEVLITLNDNELKIYKDKTNKRLLKSIKLYEFQNVEYNVQPFHFIIISYVKDKSKPLEYVYLKFDSAESMEKWDRILYVNYRLKDFKTKEKFFQLQAKDEPEPPPPQAKEYEVDVQALIKQIAKASEEGYQETEQDRSDLDNTSHHSGSLPLAPALLNSKKSAASSRAPPLYSASDDENTSTHNLVRNDTPTFNLEKLVVRMIEEEEPNQEMDENEEATFKEGSIKLVRETSNNDTARMDDVVYNKMLPPGTTNNLKSKASLQPAPEIKSKVDQLTEKLQASNIVFKKENFFRDKQKRIQIKEDRLEYIDIGDGTVKKIELQQVLKVSHDPKKNRLEIEHGEKKTVFIGEGSESSEQMVLVSNWMKLKLME